jgi:cytochrome c oxidase assembly protein subunit 11
MGGGAYAAVPLYRLFCQVTGFGGTTMVAAKPSTAVADRVVSVRFDANTRGLKWSFAPVQRTVDVKLGENTLAFYRATNTSDRPLTGTATFNVTPELAGQYFNKIECFCFKEQTLQPGESIDMPVSFFVDAAYDRDRDVGHMGEITLSYSFFPVARSEGAQKSSDAGPAAAPRSGQGNGG